MTVLPDWGEHQHGKGQEEGKNSRKGEKRGRVKKQEHGQGGGTE